MDDFTASWAYTARLHGCTGNSSNDCSNCYRSLQPGRRPQPVPQIQRRDRSKTAGQRSHAVQPATQPVLGRPAHPHQLSTDAFTNGVRATPDDAYTFAKGGEIEHAAGYGIRITQAAGLRRGHRSLRIPGRLARHQPDRRSAGGALRERLLNDGRLGITVMFAQSLLDFDLEDAIAPGWEDISRGHLAGDRRDRRAPQRPRPLHHVCRLRMEFHAGGSQPAPQCDLPQRQRAGLPFSSVDSENPAGSVVRPGTATQTGHGVLRHSAQRQCQ